MFKKMAFLLLTTFSISSFAMNKKEACICFNHDESTQSDRNESFERKVFAESEDETKKNAEIKRLLKEKYGLVEPEPEFQEEFDILCKRTGVGPNEVILVQTIDNQMSDCCVNLRYFFEIGLQAVSSKKVIMLVWPYSKVCDKERNNYILRGIGSLYHEFGHIYNRDAETIRDFAKLINTSARRQEVLADQFAIRELIDTKKINILIHRFLFFIHLEDMEKDNGQYVVSSHPSFYSRAKHIILELEKAGYNLLVLPIIAKDAKKFNEKLKLYFPNIYQNNCNKLESDHTKIESQQRAERPRNYSWILVALIAGNLMKDIVKAYPPAK